MEGEHEYSWEEERFYQHAPHKPFRMLPRQILREAERTLRENEEDGLIFAGRQHFRQVWLRDALHSLPAYALLDPRAPQRFANRLREHGMLRPDALRLGRISLSSILLAKPARFTPARVLREDKSHAPPADTAVLFLLQHALLAKKHISFLTPREMDMMIQWIRARQDADGFIRQACCADWTDTLCRIPTSSYTSILLLALAYHAPRIAERLTLSYQRLEEAFLARYDWPPKASDTDPAVAYDTLILAKHYQLPLAERTQPEDLISALTGIPVPRGRPYWKSLLVPPLRAYHTRWSWPWLQSIALHAGEAIRDESVVRKARYVRDQLVNLLEEYGMIEVSHHSKPVRSIFYRSEQGFTWTASMILLHHHPSYRKAWLAWTRG